MKTKSAKAKGRKLQDWVRRVMLDGFPSSEHEDIRCAIMGEKGADIKITGKAKAYYPWSIECKNQEMFKTIYKYYRQAEAHGEGEPVLFIKMNGEKPLAVVDAVPFIVGKVGQV